MLNLKAAAAAADNATAERSKSPLGAAKRRSAAGTATAADRAELDRNEALRAGAIARQREAARNVVDTVDALLRSGVKVDPDRAYLLGADHRDRSGEQLDARDVVAAAAAAAAKRGRKGTHSPVSGRYTLPQWRNLMLRSAAPLNRRAAEAGAKLSDDERADLVDAMTADVLPLMRPTLRAPRRSIGGAERVASVLAWIDRAERIAPGLANLMPSPADLPADLDALAYNAARRWHRNRAATVAVQAPAEAGENVPADEADFAHAVAEGLAPVAAAERAAERVGLTLSAADRWTLRAGLSGMTSPVLAALYGVAESSVRVGDMRGAAHLAELPADVLRRWGQGTGRILSALTAAPDPDAALRAAMRADVARNRAVQMSWPDRLPTVKRDRASKRLLYSDPPTAPQGSGSRPALTLLHGCCAPPRVLSRSLPAERPFLTFCAAAVPISTTDLSAAVYSDRDAYSGHNRRHVARPLTLRHSADYWRKREAAFRAGWDKATGTDAHKAAAGWLAAAEVER
jgi:hypothetical protein